MVPLQSTLLVLALSSLQLKASAELMCYTEKPNCKSGNITVIKSNQVGAAARQCCIANGGMSYATLNGEGCTTCVVYGFFATMSGGKLLGNTSVKEGTPSGHTVYFGLLKGMLPSTRRVQFTTSSLSQRLGPQRYSVTTAPWPFVTTQSTKFSVTIYASDNNIALENNVLQINPQLSSAGENEFVTPLTVAIIDTNVMAVKFSSGAYYMSGDSSTAVVTIIRGSVVPATPLKFRLDFLAIGDGALYDDDIGSTSFFFSNEPEINVSIDVSLYNITSGGFAVRLELDDIRQTSSVDLTGRNLTYVYFNENITAGFAMSEMKVTQGHSIEICVNITHLLLGMDPITIAITSDATKITDTVTLSANNLVSCVTRHDTTRAGAVVYRLSSTNTKQPLEVFPDVLTVTVADTDNGASDRTVH